jgi:hypothetical protein
MRPEDWLRERGIEVQRGHVGGHGDLASQLTGALPDADGLVPIDQIDTQRIPAVPPTFAEAPATGPDITTLPTAHLNDPPQVPPELPANLRVVRVQALDDADDGIDLWPTEMLPAVNAGDDPGDISNTPTHRLKQ